MVAPMVLMVLDQLAKKLGVTLDPPGFATGMAAQAWFFGVPALAALSAAFTGEESPKPANLRLQGDILVVTYFQGEDRVPRDAVHSGVRTPIGVDLLLRGGTAIRAEMPAAEAEALLEALQLGPDRRRAELTLGNENHRLAVGCAAFPVTVVLALLVTIIIKDSLPQAHRDPAYLLAVLAATAAPLLLRRLFAPADLVIGADGVVIRRSGRTRRVPLSAIRKTDTVAGRLVLEIAPRGGDGPPEKLHLPTTTDAADAALAWAAAERIRAAQRIAGHAAAAIPELDPAGRSLASWREALARLRRADGDYRRAQVRDEELLAVLQDGQAPAKLRIGAALALREGAAAVEARTKVRIAAETCADEELRAALEAAAEEEVAERAIRRVVERKGG
jgi:hypothetical protein